MSPVIAAIDLRRKELRMSQAQLAELAGTAQSHISDILRGNISPSLRVLERLCDALDLKLATVGPDGELVRAMHPATVRVAANQRRLAAVLGEMSEVLVDLAKVMEETS